MNTSTSGPVGLETSVDAGDEESLGDPAEAAADADAGPQHPAPAQRRRRRRDRIAAIAVLAGLAAGNVALGTLYVGLRADRDDQIRAERSAQRARQVATDYAVAASTIDFRNPAVWFDSLARNTTAELSKKYEATRDQLEQIIVPLQWNSSAVALDSVVTSVTDGVYQVNAYLNVTSTSVQSQAGVETTVVYSVTIDSDAGWKISDVGGAVGLLPGE
ncbi:hypothetical protein [Nocardia cyriacigeorgica]|uniref:hypothetical protein n=1 Tax=Nocardia cyriacigeorgica TaxID=135487 RepID=UPI00245400AD|nr:hypothetical protein [Nocardia cyriacigeorgica]